MPTPIGMTQDGKFVSAEDIIELMRQVYQITEQLALLENRIVDLETQIPLLNPLFSVPSNQFPRGRR